MVPTDGMVTGGEWPTDAIVMVSGDTSAEVTTNDLSPREVTAASSGVLIFKKTAGDEVPTDGIDMELMATNGRAVIVELTDG